MLRQVDAILLPPPPHMVGDGFRVHGFFPGTHRLSSYRTSPFLLLDYNSEFEFPPSDKARGVDVHPHKGFETVTLAFKGEVAHHDSYGNTGVIESGDVQWMTAGSGILHKEYHSEKFTKSGGLFQMIQLRVNLPKRDKYTKPKYQELKKETFQNVVLKNHAGEAKIIAGKFEGQQGPANTFSPIQVIIFELKKGKTTTFTSKESWNTFILAAEGSAEINGQTLKTNNLAMLKNVGSEIQFTAFEDCKLVYLSGEPIDEPVVQYGPFVMNTKEEIQESINEFHSGKFGHLD